MEKNKRLKPSPEEKDRLQHFAGRQRVNDGMPQFCPRCGIPSIKPRLHTNALSRYWDIYICDRCGCLEGMLASRDDPMPFSKWACMRPEFRSVPEAGL